MPSSKHGRPCQRMHRGARTWLRLTLTVLHWASSSTRTTASVAWMMRPLYPLPKQTRGFSSTPTRNPSVLLR